MTVRRVCIALHDVAPATWPACARLLAALDEFDRPPVTLLAVPNFHGTGALTAAPALVAALRRRVAGGDEIALHGYFHRDDGPPPRTPAAWLRRRVATAAEGEFSAMTAADARRRVFSGCAELGAAFGPLRGFVAPAWLYSPGAWAALRAAPLRYAATRGALVVLDGMRRVPAPAITVSARSRWRRAASRVWLRALARATASLPLVRVALHPGDAEHDDVLADWRRTLDALLARRTPVTKAAALDLA